MARKWSFLVQDKIKWKERASVPASTVSLSPPASGFPCLHKWTEPSGRVRFPVWKRRQKNTDQRIGQTSVVRRARRTAGRKAEPPQCLFQALPLADAVLQLGHGVDQDAFQNTEQLWSVVLEFMPERNELPLTGDTHTHTQIGELSNGIMR